MSTASRSPFAEHHVAIGGVCCSAKRVIGVKTGGSACRYHRMRRQLSTTIVLVIAACALCGCSAAADVTATASNAVGGAADQAIGAADSIPAASAEVCAVERRTLAAAVDVYFAQHGPAAITEAALVEDELLRTEVEFFDVTADGTIVPAPGSGCT